MPQYRFELLGSHHDRKGFSCGVDALDRYFREQVSQDVRRRATTCYVASEASTGTPAGYYTIAAGDILLTDMPEQFVKRLPRYPLVPIARMGRLAVDQAHRGRQLGAALLWDAALRAQRSELAVVALAVDAKDDTAEAFYRHHGFVSFGGKPRQLLFFLANVSVPVRPPK
jgi:ribosomal protein S18 acetylase RimI-like enzyme